MLSLLVSHVLATAPVLSTTAEDFSEVLQGDLSVFLIAVSMLRLFCGGVGLVLESATTR